MSDFTVHDLADEAKLSALEYAGFIEQCGKTKDSLYQRDESQMARMHERLVMKQRLADYMVARSEALKARAANAENGIDHHNETKHHVS